MKYKKYQIIWWFDRPKFRIWYYPYHWKYPMFKGWNFGIFEIRKHYKEVGNNIKKRLL